MRAALALLLLAGLLLAMIRLVRWRLGHFDLRVDRPSGFTTDDERTAEREWLAGGEMPSPIGATPDAFTITNEGE